jgi:hypothetical protein
LPRRLPQGNGQFDFCIHALGNEHCPSAQGRATQKLGAQKAR